MANSPEMKSYEDLKTNESIKSDENLQKLIGEIDQIKDASNKNDDKIEGIFAETAEGKEVKKVLDQNLSNSLDKQNIGTIQILIREVSNISKNPSLEEPVKSSVNDLLSLLLQTLDQKVQKEGKEQLEGEINQSFDKFKKMVEGKNDDGTNTLNKLNGLSKKEMENVLNFVKNKNNQSSVYSVYYMMKNVNIPTNFKRTDKDNFYTILNTIEATYPELKRLGTETVKNFQLNELFPENLTADDLKVLLETHYSKDGFVWNGSNIGNDFSFKNKNNGENISNSDFIAKFNEYNLKRIDSITQKGNDIIANLDVTGLTYDENSKNFMRNGNIIGKKGLFKELSGVDESNKYEKGFNLLTIDELGQDHFKTIREGWETALKNKIDSSNEQNENDGNGGFEKVNNINAGLNIGNINGYIVNKIGEGKDILRKTADAEGYECNMNNVKEFLGKISNSEIKFDKEFIKVGSDSRKAWLSAVQLLLNNQYSKTLQVDGKYGYKGETRNTVREFQKGYNKEHSSDDGFKRIKEDGVPGPETLTKLLDIKGQDTPVEQPVTPVEQPVTPVEQPVTPVEQPVTPVEQPVTTEPREQIDPDPENVTQYGFRWTRCPERASLGIPSGKNIYKKGNDGYFYYKDGDNFIGINPSEPYFKIKTNYVGHRSNKELNVCNAGANKLNAILNSNRNVGLSSVRIEGGKYIGINVSGPGYASSVQRTELDSAKINKIIHNENVFAGTGAVRNTPTSFSSNNYNVPDWRDLWKQGQ